MSARIINAHNAMISTVKMYGDLLSEMEMEKQVIEAQYKTRIADLEAKLAASNQEVVKLRKDMERFTHAPVVE